jgi:chromosome segregation ATPase
MTDTIESLRARLEVYEQDIDTLLKEKAKLTGELETCRKAAERFRKLASSRKGKIKGVIRAAESRDDVCREQVNHARRRAAQRIKEARAEADEWRLAVHEVGVGAT